MWLHPYTKESLRAVASITELWMQCQRPHKTFLVLQSCMISMSLAVNEQTNKQKKVVQTTFRFECLTQVSEGLGIVSCMCYCFSGVTHALIEAKAAFKSRKHTGTI